MAETAKIVLDLDLTKLQKELSTIPDLTAKEAKAMTREITKEVNRAARASEDASRLMARAQSSAARDAAREHAKAAREIESSYRGQFSAIKGLASAAFGGAAGDAFDFAEAAGGASMAMAGIGAALGAVALAPVIIGGAAAAAKGLADASVEARDRLQEQGIALDSLVSPGAVAAIDDYERSQRELAIAADVVTLEVGARLTPTLVNLTGTLVQAADAAVLLGDVMSFGLSAGMQSAQQGAAFVVGQWSPMLGVLVANADELYRVADAAGVLSDDVAELGVRTAIAAADEREMLTALGMVATEEDLAADAARRLADERTRNATATRAAAEAARQHAAEEREAARAAAETDRNIQSATRSMQTMGETIATSPTRSELDEINRKAAEASAGIASMNEEGSRTVLSVTAQEAAHAFGVLAGATNEVLGSLEQLASQEQERHTERIRNLRSERAANRSTLRDATRDFEASRSDMTAAEVQAAQAELEMLAQSTAAKNANIRAIEKEEERAVLKAFRRTKSLQIAQATISAATNAVILTGALAYLTWGAPVAATGIAVGQLAAELAVIASVKPPKFHRGHTPGNQPHGISGEEYSATLERGEAVVSRRAMQVPGAREIVAELERSQRPAMSGSAPVVIGDMQADALAARANRPLSRLNRGAATAGRYRR